MVVLLDKSKKRFFGDCVDLSDKDGCFLSAWCRSDMNSFPDRGAYCFWISEGNGGFESDLTAQGHWSATCSCELDSPGSDNPTALPCCSQLLLGIGRGLHRMQPELHMVLIIISDPWE